MELVFRLPGIVYINISSGGDCDTAIPQDLQTFREPDDIEVEKSSCSMFVTAGHDHLNTYSFNVWFRPCYSEQYNVTGSACRRLTQENRLLSLGHAIVCNIIVFVFVWLLVVLYTLIGRRIYAQIHQWDKRKKSNTMSKEENPTKANDPEAANKTNKQTMFRITFMFMLITFIFIISFSPKVVIFIFECLNDRFWDSLPYNTRLLVRFFDVLFIINNIANPFVYAFLDVKFSQQLKSIFCSLDYSL